MGELRNCGMAYYSKDSTGFYCKYGCEANVCFVMEEIAKKVLEDLND